MTPTESFLTNWWYHVPNLLMAAMIYSLIGRYLLELVFANKGEVVILKAFRTITNPVLKLVRAISPQVVPGGLLIVFAIAWLMAARMVWFLTAVAYGMRLTPGA